MPANSKMMVPPSTKITLLLLACSAFASSLDADVSEPQSQNLLRNDASKISTTINDNDLTSEAFEEPDDRLDAFDDILKNLNDLKDAAASHINNATDSHTVQLADSHGGHGHVEDTHAKDDGHGHAEDHGNSTHGNSTHGHLNGTHANSTCHGKGDLHSGDEVHAHTSTHVAYEDTYKTLIFLLCTFVAGKFFEFFSLPGLIGNIIVGFIMGPHLLNFPPLPAYLVLLGEIGLILLLVEAGVEIDLAQLKISGTRSLAIGLIGSILPLATGIGIGTAMKWPIKNAIALGAVFAPTSLGVASSGLNAGKVANTPTGQLIIAACVVDDVIGLVIMSMLQVLVKDNPTAWEYAKPVVSSFGWLAVLGVIGITWLPRGLNKYVLNRYEKQEFKDMICLSVMCILTFAYMMLLYKTGASYLTGAFLAGLSFSQIHSTHHAFIHHTHQIMTWLLRIFFAATIGFQIPIKDFADGEVIWKSLVFYVMVLSKFPLGLLVPTSKETMPKGYPFRPFIKDMSITGFAMTCRGEFSFMIASFAAGEDLIDETDYAAIVLAVLLSCITSPMFLIGTITYYNKKIQAFLGDKEDVDGGAPLYLIIQIRNGSTWSVQETLDAASNQLGLAVIDSRTWHPKDSEILATEMYVQDTRVTVSVADETSGEVAERQSLVSDAEEEIIKNRIEAVKETFSNSLEDPNAMVYVERWYRNEKDKPPQEQAEGDAEGGEGETDRRAVLKQVSDMKSKPQSLWNIDQVTQDAAAGEAQENAPLVVEYQTQSGMGFYGVSKRTLQGAGGRGSMEANLAGFVRK